MKIVIEIEYPEGATPAFYSGMEIHGGKVTHVQFHPLFAMPYYPDGTGSNPDPFPTVTFGDQVKPSATFGDVAKMAQELREKTNAGMMECKEAFVKAKGNPNEAEAILRKKGVATASHACTA